MKFLLGILTGIIAGLMLAPASGSETRRRISEGANDLVENSREKMQQASQTARQKARQVSDMANEKVQQATDKVHQAADYARQKAADITRSAETTTDTVAENIQRRTA
ncbi:MAG TPA: YtxH domain-containing protein [Terracidiphilus sp.]|nr:YtxH domain-containing protein [Terracidiphilus sp.]